MNSQRRIKLIQQIKHQLTRTIDRVALLDLEAEMVRLSAEAEAPCAVCRVAAAESGQ
jgi:hypothetical protein